MDGGFFFYLFIHFMHINGWEEVYTLHKARIETKELCDWVGLGWIK